MLTAAKVAIFYTDHEAEWVKPWKSFAEMGKKVLEQARVLESRDDLPVEYQVFDIYHGEFPALGEITREKGYLGIYITGSRYDSFDTETEWIIKLRQLLKTLLSDDRYPPVAGICFGHQVVAAALGCKVDRNPAGFEGGVVPVTLNSEGEKLFSNAKTLNLSEMHKDVVLEIPPGCVNWGSSSLCKHQGFYKPNKLITFQGHPEFTNMILKWGLQRIPQDVKPEMIDSIDSQHNDGPRSATLIWKLFKREI
ncbi:hypothetical protein HG536_0C01350 [Torulaspora globosa]|uniref:Glutamine amidotransferase domain-containing protein n=1 Tax=Torulaspora globosa TaxID=48254 RepID=A0A7G3ZEN1_9SACH|nr:uncharacterized protein HG536_0C01350 [Torulaspora globosa]QLL31967.1 hypothetical protein HG536_0C01350 [Torulaspora globosa]